LKNRTILAFACVIGIIAAGNAAWIPAGGPYGGVVTSLVVSGNKVFAGVYGAGLFVSADSGKSWTATYNSTSKLRINTLYNSGSALYAGANTGGVATSTDNGATWADIHGTCNNVTAITVLGSTIFFGEWYFPPSLNPDCSNGTGLGTPGALTYSLDNGKTTTNIPVGVNRSFNALATCGNTVFAASFDSLYSSTSADGPWEIITGLPSIASLKSIGNAVYAGTQKGIYFSTVMGATWKRKSDTTMPGPLHIAGATFFVTKTSDPLFYKVSGSFYSSDSGISWKPVNKDSALFCSNDVVKIGKVFIAGTDNGVFTSIDDPSTFSPSSQGITGNKITSTVISSDTILAGTDKGAFLSPDNGKSWTLFNTGLTSRNIVKLAQHGRTFFALSDSGLFCAKNGSLPWTPINKGISGKTGKMFLVNTGLLFAMSDSGLFLSVNDGATWKKSAGPDYFSPQCIAVQGNTLWGFSTSTWYASALDAFYFSADSGKTWNVFSQILNGKTVTSTVSVGKDIFVATATDGIGYPRATIVSSKILLSLDSGKSWTETNTPEEWKNSVVAVNNLYSFGSTVFVACDKGIFITSNKGATWVMLNDGLINYQVNAMSFADAGIFAATDAGLWRRPLSELPLAATPHISATPKPFGIAIHNNKSITYFLSRESLVSTELFDTRGKLVWGTSQQKQSSGSHSISLPSAQLPAGNYLLSVNTSAEKMCRKFVVVR
jgi:photosystem II stability/assembly factor-like uncharacterized protein